MDNCHICYGAGWVHPVKDGEINYQAVIPCPSAVCSEERHRLAVEIGQKQAFLPKIHDTQVETFDRRDSVDFRVSPDWAEHYQRMGLMWPSCNGLCVRPRMIDRTQSLEDVIRGVLKEVLGKRSARPVHQAGQAQPASALPSLRRKTL